MYDNLIQVMDAIRTTEVVSGANPNAGAQAGLQPQPDAPGIGDPRPTRMALFTDIAVGDAP
jgi:hypothetical protein